MDDMGINERLLLKGTEVADSLGISRSLAYRWMAGGVLPVVRIEGTRTLRVPAEGLRKWVEDRTQTGKAAA